jgi:hypothetical protein
MRRWATIGLAVLAATGAAVEWLSSDTAIDADSASKVEVGASHWVTCPVRFTDDCRARLQQRRYATVRMPVRMPGAPDGGDAGLPELPEGPECLSVVDWGACSIEEAAPEDKERPWADIRTSLTPAPAASAYVVPDCRDDAGRWVDMHAPVDCYAVGALGAPDGGPRWFGCNVFPRRWSAGTQCLDAPTGVIWLGDRLEDSLGVTP